MAASRPGEMSGLVPWRINPQLDTVKGALMVVQGKAQRRGIPVWRRHAVLIIQDAAKGA